MVQAELVKSVDLDAADLEQLANSCALAVGSNLTAFVAGSDSVADFRSVVAGRDRDRRERARKRLRVAAEVIRLFAGENMVSLVGPWLSDVPGNGLPAPARTIRERGDDADAINGLVKAASGWLTERRLRDLRRA